MLLYVDAVLLTHVYSISGLYIRMYLYLCKYDKCLWDLIKHCVAIVLHISYIHALPIYPQLSLRNILGLLCTYQAKHPCLHDNHLRMLLTQLNN